MSDRFQGQAAVITGGARGIGRAVAQRLLSEGARVAIWDMGGAQECASELGDGAFGVAVDVSDEASVSAIVSQRMV